MACIYIVTRINFDNKDGVKHIPNLGVHTSYKKGLRHYKSVLQDRIQSTKGLPVQGQCVANSKHWPPEGQCTLLMSDHFPEEEIRLEKWRV